MQTCPLIQMLKNTRNISNVSFFFFFLHYAFLHFCHLIDVFAVLWSIGHHSHGETKITESQINAELLITAMIKEFTYKNRSPH